VGESAVPEIGGRHGHNQITAFELNLIPPQLNYNNVPPWVAGHPVIPDTFT
jgi:hypothetical protein